MRLRDAAEHVAFVDAAAAAAVLVGCDRVAARWPEPSLLPGMTVGGIAAHMVSGVELTLRLLDRPLPEPARPLRLVEFFGLNRVDGPALDDAFARLIAGAAEEGARRGSASVAADLRRVTSDVARVTADLDAELPLPTARIADGTTTLGTYLATRVLELTVHADDLASSTGVAWEPPASAVDITTDLLVRLCRERDGDLAVVRGFARRDRSLTDVLRAL
jgi:uncharacterized protein (TIGR03083 family)